MGANESLIQIPTAEDLPADLRGTLEEPRAASMLTPELPDIDRDKLPEVLGWRLLVLPVRPPKTTDSGLLLATDTIRHLDVMRSIGMVLKVGPLAFGPLRQWPAGYREEVGLVEGTWVNFHANAGQEVRVRSRCGTEMVALKYLNDGDVLGAFPNAEALAAFLVLI